ncbi:thyrostimulin beta-5 subunit-like [Mytilus edulis]
MAVNHWIFLVFVVSSYLQHTSVSGSFDFDSMLACFRREYNFRATKPFITRHGLVLPCSDIITVYSCYGRCDSSEIADYKIPYKISNHKVCTYGDVQKRTVTLTNCHPLHPDPTYEVFDATFCSCKSCSSDSTSCENLNG